MKHQITTTLLNSLKSLGLTDFQAKVYAALVLLDQAQAKELLDILDISKPSVYAGLESLEGIGLAMKICTKPTIYQAIAPEMGIKLLINKHVEAGEMSLKELRELEKEKIREVSSDSFWAIYGKSTIAYKLDDMLANATTSINCSMSGVYLHHFLKVSQSDLDVHLMVISDDADIATMLRTQFTKSNFKIQIVTTKMIREKLGKMPGFSEFEGLFSHDNFLDLIVDDREILTIPPVDANFQTGIYSSNKKIVLFSKLKNRQVWDDFMKGHEPEV